MFETRKLSLFLGVAAVLLASIWTGLAHGKKSHRIDPKAALAEADRESAQRHGSLQLPIIVAPGGGTTLQWNLDQNGKSVRALRNPFDRLRSDVAQEEAKILVFPVEKVENPPIEAQWVAGSLDTWLLYKEAKFKIAQSGKLLQWTIDDGRVSTCKKGLECGYLDIPLRLFGDLKRDASDGKLMLEADYGKGAMKIESFAIVKR